MSDNDQYIDTIIDGVLEKNLDKYIRNIERLIAIHMNGLMSYCEATEFGSKHPDDVSEDKGKGQPSYAKLCREGGLEYIRLRNELMTLKAWSSRKIQR